MHKVLTVFNENLSYLLVNMVLCERPFNIFTSQYIYFSIYFMKILLYIFILICLSIYLLGPCIYGAV